MVKPGRQRRASESSSVSVLHLPARESGEAERIRKALIKQRGISEVSLDLLKGVILVEYDPEAIKLEQIRVLIGS